MPLLTGSTSSSGLATWGRPVQIGDLPAFNMDDRDFIVTDLDGWESTGKPDSVFVPNGGGAGAVGSGLWLSQEAYLTVSGAMMLEYSAQAAARRALLAAVPPGADSTIVVYGWDDEEDLQAFVRLYDRPEFVRGPGVLEFTLPLIMLDPYKYALESLTGTMGVFTGETWYRTYTFGSVWYRTYAYNATTTKWYRTYQQAAASGPYPESLTLDSAGDVASQRITFTVNGPLEAGDWWLLNETTGDRLYANVTVTADQAVVFDCQKKLATLNGSDISSYVYGSWLTLEPGQSTFRLVAGTQSDAFATVSALEAYL